MIWKDYSHLRNTHAFCGASKYAWRNYSIEKLIQAKESSYAATIGTKLHEYAAKNIKKRFKAIKGDKRDVYRYLVVENDIPPNAVDIDRLFPNLMTYINDAIGFRLDPEVILYYSPDFYGTADGISWSEQDSILRISDLKTGTTPASFVQLENYAAFFCLDYKIKPSKIKKIEFRLYQNNEVLYAEPSSEILFPIIDQVVEFNKALMAFEGR